MENIQSELTTFYNELLKWPIGVQVSIIALFVILTCLLTFCFVNAIQNMIACFKFCSCNWCCSCCKFTRKQRRKNVSNGDSDIQLI